MRRIVLVALLVACGSAAADNLFPNATSERDPPAGTVVPNDGSNAEYDFRYNAGAGAFEGSWVRRLTRSTPGTTELVLVVPATDATSYVATLRYRWAASRDSTVDHGATYIEFLDSRESIIGSVNFTNLALKTSSAPAVHPQDWTLASSDDLGFAISNAAAAFVRFRIVLTTDSPGTAELWVDDIAFHSEPR